MPPSHAPVALVRGDGRREAQAPIKVQKELPAASSKAAQKCAPQPPIRLH